VDPVVLNKAGYRIRPMLVDAEHQVAGHADIKRSIASARKDVDAWALLDHVPCRGLGPAFAGTTKYVHTQALSRGDDKPATAGLAPG
jgi:hypothetical protein